jgi:hypothetical protein
MSHRFSSFRVRFISNTNCVPKRITESANGIYDEILFTLAQESARHCQFSRNNRKACDWRLAYGVIDLIACVVDIVIHMKESSAALNYGAAFGSVGCGKTTLSYTSAAESSQSIEASSTVPDAVWQAVKLQLPFGFNEKQSIECRSWAIKT